MGSPLRLTLGWGAGVPSDGGSNAWDTVVASFEASEAAMSRFRDTSELTGLNRLAGSGRRSRALAAAPTRARSGRPRPPADRRPVRSARPRRPRPARLSRRPVAPAGRRGRDERATRHPDERVVDRQGRPRGPARAAGRSRRDRQGPRAALGGGELVRAGLTDFLLEAGGDLVARGLDLAAGPWLVGIEDPTARRSSTSPSSPRRTARSADVVTRGPPLAGRRPGRPPPARPADRRAGGRRARSRSPSPRPTLPGPRSGRRCCSSAAVRRSATRPGHAAWPPGGSPTTGPCRDDAGGQARDGLGRGRGGVGSDAIRRGRAGRLTP